MSWQRGPLAPGTFWYGAVVPTDHTGLGFFLASFHGDHCFALFPNLDGTVKRRRLEPHEVRWFNAALTPPPDQDPPVCFEGPPVPNGPAEGG